MLGIILCGGQSFRMGQDKGMLKLEEKHWAEHAYAKLRQLDIPVVISVNNNQVANYGSIFNPEQLTVDHASLDIKGPLCGVLSVHIQYPEEDLFVLACDILNMEYDMIELLYRNFHTDQTSEAFLFINDNEPEPLCAIYKSVALKHIYQMYIAGQLHKHSMKFALEQMQVSTFTITDDQKKYFKNYNTHKELKG
ncbi:MAG: molybdenum cofactor guanylyltransferase [Chitinophagaceae bacterium]